MSVVRNRILDVARVGVVVLAIAAPFAFWPTYLSKSASSIDTLTHIHALTMVLWLFLLVLQPTLVHLGYRKPHRAIGKSSFLLVPLILALALAVMHLHLQHDSVEKIREEASEWYVVPAMAAVFAVAYGLALANRRQAALHGFYMLCTALAFVNPILQRLLESMQLVRGDAPQQLVSFVLVDVILIAIAAHQPGQPQIRRGAATMLLVFLIFEVPRYTFAYTDTWYDALIWFRAL